MFKNKKINQFPFQFSRRAANLASTSIKQDSEYLNSEDIEKIIECKIAPLIFLKLCIQLFYAAQNSLGPSGIKNLVTGKWEMLSRLELKQTQIGTQGAKVLSKGQWPHLKHLRVGFNHIGNEGMKQLSKGKWRELQELFLQANKISAEGVKFLIHADWPLLIQISIWDNNLSLNGLVALLKIESKLKRINLALNKLEERAGFIYEYYQTKFNKVILLI